jgi:uncharacterized membrane-anchored protein
MLGAGAICLLILGGMIVGHAWPLWTGQTIRLKAIPVDPRDLFRGDYVRLRTPANTLRLDGSSAPAQSGSGVSVRPLDHGMDTLQKGSVVYVQLEPTVAGDYMPVSISRTRVRDKVNLYGRVRYASAREVLVDYGLDAFYLQEGSGTAIEAALSEGRNVQIEVAITASGRSRIRSLMIDGVRVGR